MIHAFSESQHLKSIQGFAAPGFMLLATASTCKTSSCSEIQDFATFVHVPTPDAGLMLIATISIRKAFSF
jgi:hypothetical protein